MASPSPTALSATDRKFNTNAVVKYGVAISTQLGLFYGITKGLDALLTATKQPVLPLSVNFFLFYFCALKSRVLNPLSNTRPNQKTLETSDTPKRTMPSWTPPGLVFPIVWLLIIGPIRALAASMLVKATGSYATPTLLYLFLHLSTGDVWNTINNVEQRYGAAVPGVYCVWLTKALAAWQFYQVVPIAGQLLGVTLVWLTIASALVTATWRLNPVDDDRLDTLYPNQSKQTKFAWFSGSNKET